MRSFVSMRIAGPVLTVAFLALGGCSRSEPLPPPVIFISIDTLRAANVTSYGYERKTTPNLDRFAEEAIVCTDAVCNSINTLISHASLLTSQYPSMHGVQPGIPLRDETETLAETLSEAGYETAFFAAHGDWLSKRYGFDQGFDAFETGYVKADQINAWALDWLGEGRPSPFFLFLHYYDVHSDFATDGDLPYSAPSPEAGTFTKGYAGSFNGCSEDGELCASAYLKHLNDTETQLPVEDRDYIRSLYDEEILYTDRMVGAVLDRLRELDLYDKAVIVITADHGEAFQEHGSFLHDTVFEGVIRVPLWIRLPGAAERGRVDAVAEGVDIVPTILDYLGLEVDPGMQGESLLRIARGEEPESDFALVHSVAMRSSRWKIMQRLGQRLVFDLEADPGEREDIAAENATVVRDAEQHLGALMERYPPMKAYFEGRIDGRNPEIEMDDAERRRLEQLGYTVPAAPPGDSDAGGDDRSSDADGESPGDSRP